MKTYMLLSLFLTCLVFATGCPAHARSKVEHGNVHFDVSSDGEKIVFSAADGDLYMLHLKSSKVTRLTETEDTETGPSFSPDGSAIVYAAAPKGSDQYSLFVRTLDGKRVVRLTNDPQRCDAMPSYSRDGSHIVFLRAHRSRAYSMGGSIWDDWDVYIVRADGSELRRITSNRYYQANCPRLLPDNNHVIYAAIPGGEQTLPTVYKADLAGAAAPLLSIPAGTTGIGAWADEPALSRDGRLMAFISDRAQPFDYDVMIANADGTKPQSLGIASVSRHSQGPVFVAGNGSIDFLAATDWNYQGRPIFSLYQVDATSHKTQRIAGSDLFTDPLQWKPEAQGPAKAKE